MSGPSEKAVEAAVPAFRATRYDDLAPDERVEKMLAAAHDPALGLDRSVCLRDVVERIHHFADVNDPSAVAGTARTIVMVAALIEFEFGGGA